MQDKNPTMVEEKTTEVVKGDRFPCILKDYLNNIIYTFLKRKILYYEFKHSDKILISHLVYSIKLRIYSQQTAININKQ